MGLPKAQIGISGAIIVTVASCPMNFTSAAELASIDPQHWLGPYVSRDHAQMPA